jgi:hypothetical protein
MSNLEHDHENQFLNYIIVLKSFKQPSDTIEILLSLHSILKIYSIKEAWTSLEAI